MTHKTIPTIFLRYLALILCALPVCNILGQNINHRLPDSGRQRINLNREWKFMLGDTAAAQPAFSDKEWIGVHLPHSFSMPYFMWKDVYNGYGWYRKEIDMPDEWASKQIGIEFEGVFIDCEVFLNGQKVGCHTGGYTGFCIDLTQAMKPGKNLLAVRVNNIWKPDVAPRAGDHQFSGGIYRDVYLHVTDPLHVAWCGTFITTPVVSRRRANVQVSTEVRNELSRPQSFVLLTTVISPRGQVVAQTESRETLAPKSLRTLVHQLPEIKLPELWSPATPHMYRAQTVILQSGKAVDAIEAPFGIRWFEWTADKGFFLNGEHLYLLGANVHQDHAGWGDAVTNAGFYRDVRLMKEAGFNTIRGSHYPHDPAFSQACNEQGMLFFPEAPFWGMGGSTGDQFGWGTPSSSCYPPDPKDQDAFDRSVLSQLKEMIRIHRNNPSITAWSLSNEAFFTDDSTVERVKELLNRATDSVHVWDPTRLVAIGGCQRRGLDKLGKNQVAFYNGDGATFPAPGVPSMVSEYGSVTTHRPGKFSPGWGDLKDGFVHPEWRGGQVIWCGFDHGTVGGEGLAIMGLVDYFRIPKRSWHWYREVYGRGIRQPKEPEWAQQGIPGSIRLTADKTVLAAPDGTDDAHILVTLVDKSEKPVNNELPVTLRILSGPGEFPTGTSICFMPPSLDEASDITIRDGQAAIEFRSYFAGTTVIEASSEGLASSTLTIRTLGVPSWEEAGCPVVADRPYERFIRATSGTISGAGALLLAKNRPAAVSSSATGSDKSLANDGNGQTVWLPDASDNNPWWSVDLEASYDLDTIELTFPSDGIYHYKIEITADNKTWVPVADRSADGKSGKVQSVEGEMGNNVRAIRICFSRGKAGLAEVKIGGLPSKQ